MAAGLGFKTFNTGDVLSATDVNGYLMQGVLVFASTAARDAAITSPQEGQFAYTKDTNGLWYYDGAAWVASGATGDIEGVTAGVGISGGGTSGTVTVTNSMATAIDAKGDLIAGTGSDAFSRIAVGANDTVLTADSTTGTGLKWAAPVTGGSLDYVLLNTGGTSLSGTSTSVSFSAQKALWIYVAGASSSAATAFYIKFNNSTTNLYGGVGVRQVSGAAATLSANNSEGQIEIGSIASAANTITTYMQLSGTDKTGYKPGTRSGAPSATGTGSLGLSGNFINRDTAALTSMQIFLDSGTFDAGTVYIYGAA
jgi:hypothetical protein